MNHNMQPNFFPDSPSGMNFPNMNYNQDIKNLENRVYNLEKEVMRLRNKIERLENTKTPYNDNYTSNYQPNSYNMM